MITKKDIKHGFGTRAHDIVGLFEKTNLLSTFMRKLSKQAEIDPLRYDSDKYVGDGFEFLMEIFIKVSEFDTRIGISKYEPVQSEDNGVDGIGYNIDNELCAVQMKFRSNVKQTLTTNQDHLSNFITDATFKYNIKRPDDNTKIPKYYIFTTAEGLNFYTDANMFKGFVKCYGIKELRVMLDKNVHFWDLCRKLADEFTQKEKETAKN